MNRFALLLLVVPLGSVSAQAAPDACTYETCALRIVDGGGYFGSQVVVRGRVGYSVAYARRSATLEELFAANDSAASYYASFQRHEKYADWFGWAGAGLMISGFVADLLGKGGLFSRSLILYGGGLTLTYGVAMPEQRKASTNLSSAIWWYNQALVGSP